MNMKVCNIEGLEYVIKYPSNFDSSNKYPVLFFLHGAGTRGNDINKLIENPFFDETEKHGDLPFIIVAPLCSEDTWFDMWERLKKLVDHISSLPDADLDRMYIMGASMGGYATWQLAMSMPEKFAAIVPICGGGMYWNASRLKDIPVWAFHGALDGVVFPDESKKMVEKVNKRGGNARLTVYPENEHNAWSDTYSNREVFEWLLSHRKSSSHTSGTDKLSNPKIYG